MIASKDRSPFCRTLQVSGVATSLLVCLMVIGCSKSETVVAEKPVVQVAFDSKSKSAILIQGAVELPTENPNAVGSQLQPAMYCEQCEKWYPVPPLSELNRNPGSGKCPKHSTPMTVDGPMPDQVIQFLAQGEG